MRLVLEVRFVEMKPLELFKTYKRKKPQAQGGMNWGTVA